MTSYYSLREAHDIINYLDGHGAGFISDCYGLKAELGCGSAPGADVGLIGSHESWRQTLLQPKVMTG